MILSVRNILGFVLLLLCISGVACQEAKVIPKDFYKEQHRPQFHFSPEANWMNDPNGMFYYKGNYHLFYQYYPDSTVWGPMHWGHAISKDMVYWEHLPIALYPDSLGYIFSGGAVVDVNNTSEFGSVKEPPIVATFTHHLMSGEKEGRNDFQYQSLAYSKDGGFAWEKYKDNPVIANTEGIKDFRDPKVVWHEESQKWIMVLAAYDRVKFYASPNLKDWEFLSDFTKIGDNRLWECPDFLRMKVDGSNEEKWVLIVSMQKNAPNGGTGTSYFVGDFDGEVFYSDVKEQKWLDHGKDNYAFVTWNNIPKDDGRTIGIGWMSNWQYAQQVPTETWRSAMTLPRELTLFKRSMHYFLKSSPVKELESLRQDSVLKTKMLIHANQDSVIWTLPNLAEVELEIDGHASKGSVARAFSVILRNKKEEKIVIEIDQWNNIVSIDRRNAGMVGFSNDFALRKHRGVGRNSIQKELKLQLFIDHSSIEVFVNDGKFAMTEIFFTSEPFDEIIIIPKDRTLTLNKAKIYSLKSIW